MGHGRIIAVWTVVCIACIGLFSGAGFVIGSATIAAENRRQLDELNRLVLARSEHEIDFAFIALGELVEAGAAGCDAVSLGSMRRQVYVRSTIKDIRVIDAKGMVTCSAFPETRTFDSPSPLADRSVPSRVASIELFRIDQVSSVAVGVSWKVLPDLALTAVLSTDSLLFGALPPGLREGAAMTLSLTNGDVVAGFGDAPEGGLDGPQTSTFTSTSDRYPLSLQLRVEAASFDTWNRDSIIYFVASGAVLGLIFGMLLARLLTLPKSPLRELDDALAAGEFVPYMQPVFSLASGRIVGCEVLVRWHRPNGETVPPSRFIPLVEQSDRIARLTDDLINRALRELRPLIDRDPEFSVAFNIAPGHFLADGFSQSVEALVRATGVRPSQIILELTERQEISDPARAAAVVLTLRAKGFKIAIDDAGTGHSGLSTVKSLGAQILKIDKFFVDSILIDHSARVIVEMLVKVAHELQMTLVAEGIEKPEQLAWLKSAGVDDGQGYLVSPAVPIDKFLTLVDAQLPATGSSAALIVPQPT
jgi:sensor c-di-GMP phosphodiesterase-like protein